MKNKQLDELVAERKPLSFKIRDINIDLIDKEYDLVLFGLDGLSEMLINYVQTHEEGIKRIEFIDKLVEFVAAYDYLAMPENLYAIQIILLNELYKKNENEPSVLRLLKEEMHFDKTNTAAFKTVIEKELREICMEEHNIYSIKDPRYQSIVKPMIKKFEDFYYSFR